MRLQNIIRMGMDYLLLGLAGIVLLCALFAIAYGIIYRKVLHGEKRVNGKKLVLAGVCFCYLVLVAGATLMRMGGMFYEVCLHPFFSYREAWNSQDDSEWRNIILNIALFVPWGFLLPLWGGRFRRFIWTVGSGLLGTIVIEGIQFALGRGVVEFDDMWNNTLGTVIGYGLAMAFFAIFLHKKPDVAVTGKKRVKWILAGLLPLVLTGGAFGTLWVVYTLQPYGNLACAANYRVNMRNVAVECMQEWEAEAENVNIYETVIAGDAEAKDLAEELFAIRGKSVDEERTDEYDDVIIYYSEDGDYSAWITYVGKVYDLTDHSKTGNGEDVKYMLHADEETVREALEQVEVYVPENAELEEFENGRYVFRVDDASKDEDKIWSGDAEITLYADGTVGDVYWNIVEYTACGEVEIISQQEAYQEILDGNFSYPYQAKKISQILIESGELEYETDSKGFFQPVYKFTCYFNGNKEADYITIPAMK